MGTHSKQLQELVETRKKYEELKALSEICFKAEKWFFQEYNSFFDCNTTSHQKGVSKYIFFVLSQPEVRNIIMNFLES